jgi:hypothetical protein
LMRHSYFGCHAPANEGDEREGAKIRGTQSLVMAAEDFSECRANVAGNRKPEFRGPVN